MKLVILSDSFYSKYSDCSEMMLNKNGRPYMYLKLAIDGNNYGIPLRHHVNHPYGYMTLEPAGLDFTKAILIESTEDISDKQAWIDSAEWNILKRDEQKIIYKFQQFIKKYHKALKNPEIERNSRFMKYCALQYFELEKQGQNHGVDKNIDKGSEFK